MFCHQCGKAMPDGGKFCPECGSAVSGASAASGAEQSLGEFKTLVRPASGAGAADAPGGPAVQMLSERYDLGEEIGRGGFAVVYKATDKKLGRTVAVKRLHPEQADALTMARFRREALAIANLNHRNIVQVFDVGEDPSDGSLFLVMELIEGGALRDLLKQSGPLPLEKALPLFKGIAQGLAYAHRKNLVHRDIKPANILLGSDGTPKIVDFGLAQAGRESELSMSGYGMGTAHYMPPEQRRDAKSVNHTADIYALGKVLYEMVTGELPDTLDPSVIPPPPELAQIIFKCTKPKPEDRYFSVDELLQELEKIDGHKKHKKAQKGANAENSCPGCGQENGDDVKFCEGCGTGLFRNCPECGRENSVAKQFCGSCGTDVQGFLTAQEVLGRMDNYLAEKKWSRVIKESDGFKVDVRLPGKKGAELLRGIEAAALQADSALKEIERLEESVSRHFASFRGQNNAGEELTAKHAKEREKGEDEKILKTLAELARLKPLSDEFQTLEKEAKARIAEAQRQAALKAKRRARNIGIGIAAVIVAGIATDQTVLAVRRNAFRSAVEHKQFKEARAAAVKLGDRYNTRGDLDALERCLEEKAAFEKLLSGQRELLVRYGGEAWHQAQEKIRLAEEPGPPLAAAEAYRAATPLVQAVQRDLADMLRAEQAFSKGWKTSGELLKQFEPATYAALTKGVEQVRTLSDPRQARDGWKRLATDLGKAQTQLGELNTAKAAYEKAVETVGANLLKQYGPADWAAAQVAVKQAGEAKSLSAAIALWAQATAAAKKAEAKVQTQVRFKTSPAGAEIAVVGTDRRAVRSSGSAARSASTPYPLEKGKAYTLTVSKKGYKTHTETLTANWYGMKEKTVVLEEWNGPEEGRKWVAELGGGVSMEFMPIAADSFQMGSNNGDSDEKPVHRVTLTKPFWLAKTEVTQAQWQQVMGGNPSHFKGADLPVETVSWNDAMSFCKKLTEVERQAGRLPEGYEYTLPTEAQWEYACRAGTTGDYAGNLDSMAWYNSNSGSKTHPVGTKQANAWGLCDMHGNVWEWCSDWYDSGYYGKSTGADPVNTGSGSNRVLRGGSWSFGASFCRSALRLRGDPSPTDDGLGFRACLVRK